jgi:excisionase family DNA binding protein
MTEQRTNASRQPEQPDLAVGSVSTESRRNVLGDDTLLTINEVASLVGVSTRQIYAMIHRRTFPFPRKIGALSRWRLGTVKDWLRQLPNRS